MIKVRVSCKCKLHNLNFSVTKTIIMKSGILHSFTRVRPHLNLAIAVGLVFVFQGSLSGQRTIQGKISDAETGEPLISANVLVKDTLIGTVTDFDGNYEIAVPEGYDILVFSYTGYRSQEVTIGATDAIDVALVSGELLEEIVVIGYGTIKKEDATGSLQSVSSEDFNRGAITSAQELIAGKIPGVTIINDGSPGGGSQIRIRGESSLAASNDPLIVIDGVPIDNSAVAGSRNVLNIVNPNDIESFTVLKDASASAIYGNRAAGGVILITTKKGAVGQKPVVGYNGNISFGNPINTVSVLDTQQYRAALRGNYPEGHPAFGLTGNASTDWQDEIYQTAFGQDHQLYAAGAFGDFPYRVSLGYTNKDGILKTDNFERFTGTLNLNPGLINNTLQLNFNFKGMITHNRFADRGAIGNAVAFDPTQAIYDPESPYGGFTTWTIPNGNPNAIAPTNPLALLELREDNSTVRQFIVNFSADYRLPFLPDMRANLNLATDRSNGEGTVIVPTNASFAFDQINGGGVNNEYEQNKYNDLLEFYLNYKKRFNRHEVDVVAGYSWQHFKIENEFVNSDAAGTPSETTMGSDPAEYYLISFYGRVNYNFDDRFLATFTLRDDGTSRFAPENRWGLFPAVALGYKLVENNRNSFNNLKIRAGWGKTGQQDIGDYYAYLARYQIGFDNARYQFGDDYVTTLRPNGYDANIQWEETQTLNIGLDFSIVRDRLSGTLDFYQRKTSDLLNNIPVPAGTNLTNFITTNVGNMENRGVELGLFGTVLRKEKFTIDLGFNCAYNDNEITNLTAVEDTSYIGVLHGGIAGGVGSNIQIHTVGFPPSSFFVFKQLYDEDGTLLEDQFEDLNNDGIINDSDKYRYEKPDADFTYGFNGRMQLHNFDLSFSCRGSAGNYVYNNVQTDQGYLNRMYHSSGSLWNVHQSAVDLNVKDQASLTFSDHFVKKANFFRMDHITLGYTFNELVGNFLRLYVTAQNVFVVTEYDGLDPEVSNGIDNNIYPRPRTIVFGVGVEF